MCAVIDNDPARMSRSKDELATTVPEEEGARISIEYGARWSIEGGLRRSERVGAMRRIKQVRSDHRG